MSAWLDFGELKRAGRLEWVWARYRITDLRRSGGAQYRGRCPIHGGKGSVPGDQEGTGYKVPAGFAKSRAVFNLSRAAARGEPWVVVVEGFLDCLKVHQAGIRSGVAHFGCLQAARRISCRPTASVSRWRRRGRTEASKPSRGRAQRPGARASRECAQGKCHPCARIEVLPMFRVHHGSQTTWQPLAVTWRSTALRIRF